MGYAWVCMKSCTSGSDCRSGYVCNTTGGNGVCVPNCFTSPDVCDPDGCNTVTGFCELQCFQDQDCGPGSFCDTQSHTCFCSTGSMCRSNATCNNTSGLCGCKDNTWCPADRTCNTASGECR